MVDDEAARKARAENLEEEITRLTSSRPQAGPAETERTEKEGEDRETRSGESPREFIRRRMRELDQKKSEPREG
jgi:hypothetical protein